MLVIDNQETADDYAATLTLESKFGGRLVYLVANQSAVARFRPLVEVGGSDTAEYGPEILLTPQSSFIDRISAAKFRSAVVGQPARVIAQLSEPGDILPASGTPFTGVIQASGQVTPAVVSVGMLLLWPTDTPPTGWLLCDGQAVSRTDFVGLFSVIGVTYGAGDGSTTFNVPDLRGRVPVGRSPTGPALINTIADNDGRAAAVRNISHHHRIVRTGGAAGTLAQADRTDVLGSDPATTGDGNNQDYPAFLVLNYIIASG